MADVHIVNNVHGSAQRRLKTLGQAAGPKASFRHRLALMAPARHAARAIQLAACVLS